MVEIEIGTLEQVPVRDIWPDEAHDFTPWLAKNLGQLGAELEMTLELVDQEVPAGRFKLDVLARDTDFEVLVAIENQLEPTDHNHLGQLLTYAGSHDVRRLIWISPDFLPEHRAALEWLNEWTDDEIEVYGVKVSGKRIGQSPYAPVFEKVVYPSVRMDRTEPPPQRQMTRSQFYSRFYRLLNEGLANEGIYPISAALGGWVARYRQYYTDRQYPGTSYASRHDPPPPGNGRVYIGFRTWDDDGEATIEILRQQKDEIDRETPGVELDWSETEIWISKPASYDDSEEEHIATRAWMFENLVNLKNAIQPRLDVITGELDPAE